MATTGANVLRRRRQDDDDSDDESEEETSEEMDRNAENAAFAHAAAKIHMQDEKGMKVWKFAMYFFFIALSAVLSIVGEVVWKGYQAHKTHAAKNLKL
jgi:hypothetical protein